MGPRGCFCSKALRPPTPPPPGKKGGKAQLVDPFRPKPSSRWSVAWAPPPPQKNSLIYAPPLDELFAPSDPENPLAVFTCCKLAKKKYPERGSLGFFRVDGWMEMGAVWRGIETCAIWRGIEADKLRGWRAGGLEGNILPAGFSPETYGGGGGDTVPGV